MDEVVLNRDERIDVEKLADLFAIITATEALEAAYNRGAVNCDEYERECKIFISKFKDTEAALIDDGRIKDVATFIAEYEIDCSRARNRLLVVGVPATTINASANGRGAQLLVAEATQALITAHDALSLEQRAFDEIQPLVQECMTTLIRIPGITEDFESCKLVSKWLLGLHGMRVHEELNDEQFRDIKHDLGMAYQCFMNYLKSR